MSTTATTFVPQAAIVQQVNVETAVSMLHELTAAVQAGQHTPDDATMRLLGTLRHAVHPDMGEALEEFSVALRAAFVAAS